jgi:hypothetical protein
MATLVAPPEIFSAYAVAAVDPALYQRPDLKIDPYLAAGTHLRVYAGMGMSFPIAPFAVFPTKSSRNRLFTLDPTGAEVNDNLVFLSREVEASIGLNLPQLRFGATVRVDLVSEDAAIEWVVLQDQHGRIIYGRDRPLWNFAAPVIHRLRMGGDGEVRIEPREVDLDTFFGVGLGEGSNYVIGLPVRDLQTGQPGRHNWYLGLHDPDTGMMRVEEGAPQTLNRMDVPLGPFAPVSGSDERDRIAALIDSDPDFHRRLFEMLNHDAFPWAQINEPVPRPVQTTAVQAAHLRPASLLQMAAMDPGMARYLGFSALYKEWPNLCDRTHEGSSDWDTFGVVGLFAIDPRAVERLRLDLEDPTQGNSGALLGKLIDAISGLTGELDAGDLVLEQIHRARDRGAVPAVFATFAAPVLPPLPPTLPTPEIVTHHWQASDGTVPSDNYRAGFAFPDIPMVSLTALGRDSGSGVKTAHRLIGADRAVPAAMGYELEPNARQRFLGRKRRVQRHAGLLADQDIDEARGETTCYFAASDQFGRFGEPSERLLGPPPRPRPPKPTLRSWLERPGVVTETTASPGKLKVTVAVPRFAPGDRFTTDEVKLLGRVIVVPRLDDLAAGALPLVRLDLKFNNQVRPIDLRTPGFFDESFDLPKVSPGWQGSMVLTGCYFDAAGTDSAIDEQVIEFADLRPPPVNETGVGLFWTSAPGLSPEVELKLTWKGVPNSRYRVYLTDAVGLGLSADADRTLTRAQVAVDGCNRMRNGFEIRRENFRLLTDTPILADHLGYTRFTARLPRSLSPVQFLRVVPVGHQGVEADFAKCPIVPVAVPESRHPVPPRLEGIVDAVTSRATLIVTADGFDRDRLKAEEPGLFQPGEPGTAEPEFRLRRAVGAVAEPIYARVVGSGKLTLVDAAATPPLFSASLSDPAGDQGLEAFVRYTYWAEVRLPPERRGPAGVPLLDPAGGIRAPDAVSRESHARPFSSLSAPRQLMRVPDMPPSAPQNATASRTVDAAGNVTVSIALAHPPQLHVKAIDQYRLAVWTQWGAGPLTPIDNVDGTALPDGRWPVISSGQITSKLSTPESDASASLLRLRIGYVDPLGRLGSLTELAVPGAG